MGMINWIRVRRGGMCTGLGQYLLDRCTSYIKNRQAFGGPLSRFQALQWMIVDSYLDVQAMKSMSLQCLWQADQGIFCTMQRIRNMFVFEGCQDRREFVWRSFECDMMHTADTTDRACWSFLRK